MTVLRQGAAAAPSFELDQVSKAAQGTLAMNGSTLDAHLKTMAADHAKRHAAQIKD